MPRILIVDDAETDRTLAAGLLRQSENLEVETATNGRDALERIAQQAPDLVVTDLIMPEMDGLELVEELDGMHPQIPVIIMTAKGSEETAVRALQQGAASYVPKHILPSSLLDTVESVLAVAAKQHRRASLMKMMLDSRSSFVLGNDRALFRPLVQFVQDTMADFGLFDARERMRVCVAVEEALNNAAEHGNLELDSALREEDFAAYVRLMRERCADPRFRDRRVRFEARFAPSEAVFEITDEGPGFDLAALPDPESVPLDATSGRGLRLMRTFMDDVEFNETGNVVRLTKHGAP